ncbi:phosphoenolpyruvate--protein phosphotransferase [Actinoplanes sp. Pm04-4]|uniref:Phosphocarrier protein HPr n=1 Tax=Paractinoplanes pyxinae TaxID=2997416 RepID=A0ABT4BGJ7_9ACTN|nr:phosphoenolpyruvate--protein phosphotransferase [Actinoplanes pyxinae]MCY1144688.1 phosphoenolpyruvate--protein phosphotransferase [Actinoplanes pyxinae]
MVGLVVVGHSRALATAAVALASEMTQGRPLAVEVAAGLDETTFGTDAVAISEAITAADSGDGVVVLMDMGSAVLSAELALEMVDEPDRVILSPAPLVEGLIAAAVAAASGADRHEVADEAANGLAGKQSHFQPESPAEEQRGGTRFKVVNEHGLHARPAARLVTEVRAFDARVELRNATTGSGWVPASSLTRVATLGALQNHELEVRGQGREAAEAVNRVVALAAIGFGDTDAAAANHSHAGGASPGVGIGPAVHLSEKPIELPDAPSQGSDIEWRRLTEALQKTRDEIGRLHSPIFDAHLLLLEDDDLLTDVRARLDRGEPAPQAWSAATTRIADEFDALPDPYLKGRAADVRAVAQQVLRALLKLPPPTLDGDGVLLAADLTPADAAALDPKRIAGVVLASGSPTSHAAILTRTRGIPAVVGAGPRILEIPDGTLVAMDGGTGDVVADPSPGVLAAYREKARQHDERRAEAAQHASAASATGTGVTIDVGANVGSVEDARAAAANGADLAGLVRTEFLFLDRDQAPTVDEQVAVYREIAQALGGRRITLRTLDAGSDKPLPYLPPPTEANPFLGVRGLRHSLTHPEMFAEQLTAIVRVARETPVSIMFPMVTTVDELKAARAMLAEAGDAPGLQVGMMVEVPAAALRAADFIPYVDFFSIGTNDLTQYTLAAERGNAALSNLTAGLDPAVAQLIDHVCRAAGDTVLVSVCGELAGDEEVVPRLIASGVRELSVAPGLVPLVKRAVRAA